MSSVVGLLVRRDALPENGTADAEAARDLRDAEKPRTQVPVWREGLAWTVLSVDYQRILQVLADRHRLHQGPLTCQEMLWCSAWT